MTPCASSSAYAFATVLRLTRNSSSQNRRRAASVRRYLAGRGVDADTPAIRDVPAARDRGHVDIVVRSARR